MQLLQQWQTPRRKTTDSELLSFIGKLSFTAKVIPALSVLMLRSRSYTITLISLTVSVRADIRWWLDFSPGWNGVSPMLQADWVQASDLQMFLVHLYFEHTNAK